jgi:aminoglycoside phosphotransferase (APT) family kinase protein
MHDVGVEKGEITADVASRLIAEQFPQWSHLAVTPVELDGWDNTTFRLGDDLSVRLQARNRCRMSPPWLRVTIATLDASASPTLHSVARVCARSS